MNSTFGLIVVIGFFGALNASIDSLFEQFLQKKVAVVTQRLLGGYDDTVTQWLCVADNKKYVVRFLSGPLDERKNEILAHIRGASFNKAPHVYFYAPDYSAVIMDFIEGRTLLLEDIGTVIPLETVAHALQAVAQSVAAKAGVLLADMPHLHKIDALYTLLRLPDCPLRGMVQKAYDTVCVLRERMRNAVDTFVFSHADLNPRNIFFKNNELICIDWSNAGFYPELFDCVQIAYFFVLTSDQERELIKTYLQRDPSGEDKEHFAFFKYVLGCCDVLYLLNAVQKKHDLSTYGMGDIKDFRYYNMLFAQREIDDSPEFMFKLAISGLRGLLASCPLADQA